MLSRAASRSLPGRAHPAFSFLSSRIYDALSAQGVAGAATERRADNGTRAFATRSFAMLSPIAMPRSDYLMDPTKEQSIEFVKSALHAVLNIKNNVSKKLMTQEELRLRLKAFQDLFLEARQCIEDCADSAESTDFDEEAMSAKDAVEEACSAYLDIIDDLEGAEQASENYPFGVVKKSDFVRISQEFKIIELKEQLAVIMREWRSPPTMTKVT